MAEVNEKSEGTEHQRNFFFSICFSSPDEQSVDDPKLCQVEENANILSQEMVHVTFVSSVENFTATGCGVTLCSLMWMGSCLMQFSRYCFVVYCVTLVVTTLTIKKKTATDLSNALPGNSSVNTVQHSTIEEAVFSVYLTDTQIDWLDGDYMICVYCRSMSVWGTR
jgi:hypothetical protein